MILKYLGQGLYLCQEVTPVTSQRTKKENNYIWADYIHENIVYLYFKRSLQGG